jgi:hypothetical protein
MSDSMRHLFKFSLLEQTLKRRFQGVFLLYSAFFKVLHTHTGVLISPTRKETSNSDQTLTFTSHAKKKKIQKVVRPTRSPRQQ